MDIDTIFNKNCLDGLKALPDKSIDLILTDPPYGKKADKGTNGFGAAKNRRYAGGWDSLIPPPPSIYRDVQGCQQPDNLRRQLLWAFTPAF